MAKTKSEPTFADELTDLEKTVRELEGGRLDLDAALEKFEHGVKLTRKLRARLDDAEGRVEVLLADVETKSLDVD